jgi:hypothetical protein
MYLESQYYNIHSKEASENISKKSELIISRTLYNINKMNENFSIILIS